MRRRRSGGILYGRRAWRVIRRVKLHQGKSTRKCRGSIPGGAEIKKTIGSLASELYGAPGAFGGDSAGRAAVI